MTMEIIFDKDMPMYFIGGNEISKPQLVRSTITLTDGREIIAIAERGKHKFMLTANDLKDMDMDNIALVDTPDWLLVLNHEQIIISPPGTGKSYIEHVKV